MSNNSTLVATSLASFSRAIDVAVERGDHSNAIRMSQAVLAQLPRHLPTYVRVLQIYWQMERWDDGEVWARRLLQADPANAYAWRALAMAAEDREERAQSNVIWRRAFEMDPYHPDIRAGLYRTSIDTPNILDYDLACLASFYRYGGRWSEAADAYHMLVEADSRRIDFQLCLTVALWQGGEEAEAYSLARHLVQRHPHLLMAWRTIATVGDENDQALAANPITTMDPSDEYGSIVWAIGETDPDTTIQVDDELMALMLIINR